MAQPERLKVIALISGGKDSVYSMLHCLDLGHEVVALANLFPPLSASSSHLPSHSIPSANVNPSQALDSHSQTFENGIESEDSDLNSFMYQTAGHTLIPLYEEALGIPLYRRPISGQALNKDLSYAVSTAQTQDLPVDETEDLYLLIQDILKHHPGANAVSSGAILSTYQRTRVESVAVRLGLVPLAFLWEYPALPTPMPSENGLLSHMAAVGIDARIVKVAAGGLDERILWHNVTDEKTVAKIERSVGRFGGSVLGEGGEFETLVTKGPDGVWKGEIHVEESERMVVLAEGGEAFLRFKKGAGRVERSLGPIRNEWRERLVRPRLFDMHFEHGVERSTNSRTTRPSSLSPRQAPKAWKVHDNPIIRDFATQFSISNVTSTDAGVSIEEQTMDVCSQIEEILWTTFESRMAQIDFVTILLRSMADFPTVNRIYGRFFTEPLPPSRVTVSCGDAMPEDADIMLSLNASRSPSRQGLHVQSRSYWAPANIGPYSQAIKTDLGDGEQLVQIAGQIPLVPSTMQRIVKISEDSDAIRAAKEAALALQHLWRVGTKMGVQAWTHGIAFVAGPAVPETIDQATQLWRLAHQSELPSQSAEDDHNDEDFDIWNLRHGLAKSHINDTGASRASANTIPDQAAIIDERTSTESPSVPKLLVVEVSELPRGSPIEWQGLGVIAPQLRYQDLHMSGHDIYRCHSEAGHVCIDILEIEEGAESAMLEILALVPSKRDIPSERDVLSVTVYTIAPELFSALNVQLVPCLSVYSEQGRSLVAAVVIHRVAMR